MLLRRYKGDPVLPVHLGPTLLVALPGACLLLLRLLLPAPNWTRLLVSYRPLRYVVYVVAKLLLAAAAAREQQQQHVASFGVLRGLGHALMEGVLLPLCCPVSGCGGGGGLRRCTARNEGPRADGGRAAAVLPGEQRA